MLSFTNTSVNQKRTWWTSKREECFSKLTADGTVTQGMSAPTGTWKHNMFYTLQATFKTKNNEYIQSTLYNVTVHTNQLSQIISSKYICLWLVQRHQSQTRCSDKVCPHDCQNQAWLQLHLSEPPNSSTYLCMLEPNATDASAFCVSKVDTKPLLHGIMKMRTPVPRTNAVTGATVHWWFVAFQLLKRISLMAEMSTALCVACLCLWPHQLSLKQAANNKHLYQHHITAAVNCNHYLKITPFLLQNTKVQSLL